MPIGHHFTHCRYCQKEYVCGDCITDECELGRGQKKSCQGYKGWLEKQMATANMMNKLAKDNPSRKRHAVGVMLADAAHADIVHELDNKELADAVLEEVWASLAIGSREGALIAECIERLRNKPI